jgi:transposase
MTACLEVAPKGTRIPPQLDAVMGPSSERASAFFASIGFAVRRIGLEAGPLSAWLHAGLKRAGFDTVLLEMIEIKPWYAASRPRPDCIS